MSPKLEYLASPEALFRYQVVSTVMAYRIAGAPLGEAVRIAAKHAYYSPKDAQLRHVAVRTLYRWVAAFERSNVEGLEPASRKTNESSAVLSKALLSFLREESVSDGMASIPELLDRALERGVLTHGEPVCRITVWRAMRRMGLDVRRRKKARNRDTRRWAYPHRMQMVLCDGKHFRAGAKRLKRVVLFFLDDSTRVGLHAVVGPSESSELFLRGLYETICKHGLMDMLYLDRGPGFIALDTADVVRKLGALLILGEVAYPEGHGKIEKLNQFALHRLLRNLDNRPDVDPDCRPLELRAQHLLREVYNHRPHESLAGRSPWQCWEEDERSLRFPDSDAELRRCFVVHETRHVSNDHIVSVDGVLYEVPRGHGNTNVHIHRQLLDHKIAMPHDGKLVTLQPVDLVANAHAKRGKQSQADDKPAHPLPPTAAELRWRRDLAPVVSPDGGFSEGS